MKIKMCGIVNTKQDVSINTISKDIQFQIILITIVIDTLLGNCFFTINNFYKFFLEQPKMHIEHCKLIIAVKMTKILLPVKKKT